MSMPENMSENESEKRPDYTSTSSSERQQSSPGLERMESRLSRGKWNFVLWFGVIRWGFSAAFLASIFQYFGNPSAGFQLNWPVVAAFMVTGVFFGLFMWSFMNKQYAKLKRELAESRA